MSALKELVNELNQMILQGRTMEAFEKLYDDNVVMQENEEPPTVGKDANRKREEAFLNQLIDLRDVRLHDVAIGDGVTMVRWTYDYTHKEWGTKKYTQVSVQHWRNGRITHEYFYYNN